jgi:hypothetical protein
MYRSISIALAALAAGATAAQEAGRPVSTNPRAPTLGVEYRSAFAEYQPFADEKIVPWRDANEAVKNGGGHAGHAAKRQGDGQPAAKPPAKAGGHEDQGGHR